MKKLFSFKIGIIMLLNYSTIMFAQNTKLPMDNNGCAPHSLLNNKNVIPIELTLGNPWTLLGPNGGDALDLAVDPLHTNIIYAAVDKLFESTNNGVSWQVVQSIPISVNSVEVNGNGVVFASGLYTNKIVYCSTDNGATWQEKTYTATGGVYDIAIDPGNNNTVYVALSTNTILKSTNLGNNWSNLNISGVIPSSYSIYDILVDPGNSQIITAIGASGFTDRKFILTTNGGTNWFDRSGSIPAGGPVNKVTISGQNIYIYGGMLFGGNYLGVFKSTDQGVNWQNLSTSFPNKVSNDLIVSPADPNKIYVATEGDGVYYTTNGGTSWIYTTTGVGDNSSARCLAFEPGNPNIIYSGFQGIAVCKSTNGGLGWSYANDKIATLLTNDIEADLNNPSRMIVSFEGENSGGCYLTNDGGTNWTLVSGLPMTRYSKVTYGADAAIYAWSNGPTTIAQEGLYKSTNGGINWINMGPDFGSYFETQIFSLYISPTNPNLIYIGGNNFGVNGWASVIHRSTNGGQNWANVFIGPAYDSFRYLIADPGNEQIVYASYLSGNGIGGFLKSTDGGTNWFQINNGLPASFKMAGAITCVPGNSNILYGGIGGYSDINATMYKSTNGGNSWNPTSLTLNTTTSFTDIVLSPTDSNVIYASSAGMGIYLSTNAGNTWAIDNNGLPAVNITGLSRAFMQSGTGKLCASTYKNSAYITNLYIITSIADFVSQNTNLKVYPNPSIGDCNIYLIVEKTVNAKVLIYNSSGQLIQTLVSEKLDCGNYHYVFHNKPGIYFIQATIDGKIVSGKILIQ